MMSITREIEIYGESVDEFMAALPRVPASALDAGHAAELHARLQGIEQIDGPVANSAMDPLLNELGIASVTEGYPTNTRFIRLGEVAWSCVWLRIEGEGLSLARLARPRMLSGVFGLRIEHWPVGSRVWSQETSERANGAPGLQIVLRGWRAKVIANYRGDAAVRGEQYGLELPPNSRFYPILVHDLIDAAVQVKELEV